MAIDETVHLAGLFGDGHDLSNLNASNIALGVLDDARLSDNVALLSNPNVWLAGQDLNGNTLTLNPSQTISGASATSIAYASVGGGGINQNSSATFGADGNFFSVGGYSDFGIGDMSFSVGYDSGIVGLIQMGNTNHKISIGGINGIVVNDVGGGAATLAFPNSAAATITFPSDTETLAVLGANTFTGTQNLNGQVLQLSADGIDTLTGSGSFGQIVISHADTSDETSTLALGSGAFSLAGNGFSSDCGFYGNPLSGSGVSMSTSSSSFTIPMFSAEFRFNQGGTTSTLSFGSSVGDVYTFPDMGGAGATVAVIAANGATFDSGAGAPTTTPPNGSIYTNTSASYPGGPGLYIRIGGSWIGLV